MGQRGRPNAGFGTGPMLRGGRRVHGQKLGAKARERISEAHALAQGGQYADAAVCFNEVAAIARERSLSRMACFLSVQAARCCAQAGDQEGLVAATDKGIGDAKIEADADHASRTFGDLLAALAQTPYAHIVPDLEGAIRSALGVTPTPTAPQSSAPNRSLQRHMPSECGACSSKVSPASVNFNNTSRADCPFCGEILVA